MFWSTALRWLFIVAIECSFEPPLRGASNDGIKFTLGVSHKYYPPLFCERARRVTSGCSSAIHFLSFQCIATICSQPCALAHLTLLVKQMHQGALRLWGKFRGSTASENNVGRLQALSHYGKHGKREALERYVQIVNSILTRFHLPFLGYRHCFPLIITIFSIRMKRITGDADCWKETKHKNVAAGFSYK